MILKKITIAWFRSFKTQQWYISIKGDLKMINWIVNWSYKRGQFYRKWIEQVGKPAFCFLKISLGINCSSFNSLANSLIIALLAYFFVWLKALNYNFGFMGTFTWERLQVQFIMVAMIISKTVFFFQTF